MDHFFLSLCQTKGGFLLNHLLSEWRIAPENVAHLKTEFIQKYMKTMALCIGIVRREQSTQAFLTIHKLHQLVPSK